MKKNNKAQAVVGNFLIQISNPPLSQGPFHVECLLCSGTKTHLAKLSVEIFSFAKYKSLTYFVLFLILRPLLQYSFLILLFLFPIILAQEYIHYIANVVHEKVVTIVVSKGFKAMLSDGSQMRKNGNEKEVVLVSVEYFGISVYCVVSLLDMATFGGTNADTLKKV